MLGYALEPRGGIKVFAALCSREHLVAASWHAGRIDNADIVAARREQESGFGLGQQKQLVYRTPRRDMVAHRADAENGALDVGQRHGLVADRVAAACKVVVQK